MLYRFTATDPQTGDVYIRNSDRTYSYAVITERYPPAWKRTMSPASGPTATRIEYVGDLERAAALAKRHTWNGAIRSCIARVVFANLDRDAMKALTDQERRQWENDRPIHCEVLHRDQTAVTRHFSEWADALAYARFCVGVDPPRKPNGENFVVQVRVVDTSCPDEEETITRRGWSTTATAVAE